MVWASFSRKESPIRRRADITRRPGRKLRSAAFLLFAVVLLAAQGAHAADAAFQKFLAETWPQAQALGVSRATFDAATRGLEPDLSLPDLALPGRPEQQPQQPEFVQTPAQYLREPTFERLAARGKRRAGQCGAGDLGARDRLRRRETAARRHPRAGHASLCRQAQGFLPQRIPARAENAAGRRAARRLALVLGRRHGAHAIPAVGVLQIRGRF